MKFSIKDFFCKLKQIRRKLHISPNLLKKSLTESSFLCKGSCLHLQFRVRN